MTDNRQIVVGFLDLAFNAKQPAEAFARYVTESYIQHNPHAPDGARASAEHLAGFVSRYPDLRLEIRRVIAEGDLVVTHSLMKLSPEDRGTAIADIVRLADGKIAEHWDVAQPVPETMSHTNTMF